MDTLKIQFLTIRVLPNYPAVTIALYFSKLTIRGEIPVLLQYFPSHKTVSMMIYYI